MEYYRNYKIDTKYFSLLELQRVLRYIEYDKLELQFLNPLRNEVDKKIKEKQEEKNGK